MIKKKIFIFLSPPNPQKKNFLFYFSALKIKPTQNLHLNRNHSLPLSKISKLINNLKSELAKQQIMADTK